MTETASENVTVTGMVFPVWYAPLGLVDEMFVTIGAVVVIMMSLFAPSEFAAPGAGRVRTALLFDASLIVPLFSFSELVEA